MQAVPEILGSPGTLQHLSPERTSDSWWRGLWLPHPEQELILRMWGGGICCVECLKFLFGFKMKLFARWIGFLILNNWMQPGPTKPSLTPAGERKVELPS